MIKFILALVVMILLGLVTYVYMNQKNEYVAVAKVERHIIKDEALLIQRETLPVKAEVIPEKKVTEILVVDSKIISENLTKTNYSDSLASTEEEVQIFEEKIAQEFSEQSEYTGKIYNRDDYLGNEVSFDDSMSQDEEENKYTEEWQQKEINTPPEE
ncbi:MAG TPA: hypothetical protein EYG73_02820 [Arcobacter sp.]|nr:hypothetical protein [Arcobacter sp.]